VITPAPTNLVKRLVGAGSTWCYFVAISLRLLVRGDA
jgi:hypothetical protein